MVGAARTLTALAAVVSVASVAHAEPADDSEVDLEVEAFVGPPEVPRVGRTYSERIADELTLLGDAIDGHVRPLTLDSVKFRVDGRGRRAHLRVARETRYLALTIQSDVHFRRGAAGVDTVIDLRVAGKAMRFELPELELVPKSYLGDRYVEVRVPLLRGTF